MQKDRQDTNVLCSLKLCVLMCDCDVFNGSKKTQTWFGTTVAGTLSTWCPTYFLSGTNELKQSGWWKLTDPSPPTIDICQLHLDSTCRKQLFLSSLINDHIRLKWQNILKNIVVGYFG